MIVELPLGEVTVDVMFKDIRNIHLSVHPPSGRIRLAAPTRMPMATLRAFAISKLGWIKRQQRRLDEQERETPREFLPRESHYVWGHRYLLDIAESSGRSRVELDQHRLHLHVRTGASASVMASVLDAFYREQVRSSAAPLLQTWGHTFGIRPGRLYIQRMKTRWGGCNQATAAIRLNSELAKKPRGCLEYIVVHELAHVIEPTHNERFLAIMDRVMPTWRHRRDLLNRLPISHQTWDY